MTKDGQISGGRRFLSLKWRVLGLLSLVLALMSISLTYLVYARATGQFEAEQAAKRASQIRELDVVLSQGVESMVAFASFIPMLSTPLDAVATGGREQRIAAVLDEHGIMLDVEWGFEGVHYFDRDDLNTPKVSWPAGRTAPPHTGLLERAWLDEGPQGELACVRGCVQIVALPLLSQGETVGALLLERSVADSLEAFHLLSGAEIALLRQLEELRPGDTRHFSGWGLAVAGITHEQEVFPIIQDLADNAGMPGGVDAPRRIQRGNEWFEVFRIAPAPGHPTLDLLVVNRVTEQMRAIRKATADSLILGLIGLMFSELILLLSLWGPMRRIQDIAFALPLIAGKSYARLRQELPALPGDKQLRDEIDVMVSVLDSVSEQVETLDAARTAAENALRESEQGLQLAQSMAKVASWVGQPLDGLFRIGQGADHISRVLRYVETWDDFVGLVHPDDQSRLRIAWRRGRGGSVMDIEFRLVIGEREIDVHAVAQFEIVDTNRVLRAAGMLQDITDMRAAERALKAHRDRLEDEVLLRTAELVTARKQAERLAKNKGRFLANMSHEIRTPLNAILGLSQLGFRKSRNRAIATTFEQIVEAGEHLLKVVNDVLDISKLEAGKLVIEKQPFSLRNMVGQCTEMLRERVLAKSLAYRVAVADDLPERLSGDAFRIQQVLINLLSNAIKFTDRGAVSLDVFRDARYCCFRVTDTGIGMTGAEVSRLFRPFQQLAKASDQRREGTGLGLSISSTLAVMMGGDIQVRSRPGSGSEFVLRVPFERVMGCDEPEGAPRVEQGDAAKRLDGLRVAVADDVALNRLVLQSLLELEGAEVSVFGDGTEVVAAVLAESGARFDVVLLDVMMPQMDGREATRRIREAGCGLPVIGVTAHVSAEEREASLAAGMNEQMVKPIMQDDLVEAILRLLNR